MPMQKISTIAYPLIAVVAWALTVVLVMNLLGGVFDGRGCQTTCFQILYGAALAIALVGFIGNVWYCMQNRFTVVLAVSALALFGLLGVLLTTALIGSL